MKYIKVLGLAAIAATALIAFVGASSASATVLCKVTPTGTNPATCPTASTYGAGTIIKGTATGAILTPSGLFPNVICRHSETEADVTNTGGATSTVVGTVTALTFKECFTEDGVTPCEVEVENLPYKAEVHWVEGTHNGNLTVSSHGFGDPGAVVTCAGVIECTFSNSVFNLPITGGNPAHVTANGVSLTIGAGAICPSSAKWDATYEAIGTNTAIWVAKEEV